MRAGIGLIALLAGVALMFYLMSSSASVDLKAQHEAKTQVDQISGKTDDGRLATDSLTFEAGPSGIKVLTVEPNGAFDQHFGLLAGDVILEIGPLMAKDQAQDNSTAKAFLHDAYARNENLIVRRGSERLDLPTQRTTKPSGANASPADSQNSTPKSPYDLVHKIETH